MKVLVTGSRHWTNAALIREELALLSPGSIVIHGGARGADAIADAIAKELGLTVREYRADWLEHGLAAGPMRNSDMLRAEHDECDVKVDYVLAFTKPDTKSPGTADMKRKAFGKGIRIKEIAER